MRKKAKIRAPDFAPHFFGKHGNNGSFSFPLFPQSPENPVKSGYLEAMEIMEFYPDLLLTEGSLVRAQQGEPEKSTLRRAFFNDVCPAGQMMRASHMMLPSAMMCACGT